MKPTISLRRYLSLQLGLVLVLQFAIVALLVWQVLLPRMRTDIGFRHQALARSLAGQVTALLMGGERQLIALVDFVEIHGSQPPSYWFEILDSQCGDGDLFEAIYLADYQNEVIYSVGLARLGRSKRDDLMGLSLSGRDFLSRARQLDKTVWSDTFLSTASSRWAVAVTVPMAQGAITGEITVDQLDRFISDLPLASGMFTMILDRRGRVIADSQGVDGGQQPHLERLLAVGVADTGAMTSSTFNLDGRRLIGTTVTVDQLGWEVLVAQSYQGAFQLIQSAFIIIALGLFLALLCGVIFVVFQADKLTRLFRLYEQKAHSISRGQYDLLWPRAKTIEFADLADSLQQMAMKISQRESQMVASENHLNITLDSIGDAVITTDIQSVVTRMNPMAEQLTGWTSDEAIGQPLSNVFYIIIAAHHHRNYPKDCTQAGQCNGRSNPDSSNRDEFVRQCRPGHGGRGRHAIGGAVGGESRRRPSRP